MRTLILGTFLVCSFLLSLDIPARAQERSSADDLSIAKEVRALLIRERAVFGRIRVEVRNGRVRLWGDVPSEETVRRAEEIAYSVPGVTEVINEINTLSSVSERVRALRDDPQTRDLAETAKESSEKVKLGMDTMTVWITIAVVVLIVGGVYFLAWLHRREAENQQLLEQEMLGQKAQTYYSLRRVVNTLRRRERGGSD